MIIGQVSITWSSKKQFTVSRSSTEAEYGCLASCVVEILWIKSLLYEIRVPIIHVPAVYCDNSGAVKLAANPVLHARTKHVEIDLEVNPLHSYYLCILLYISER